MNHFSIRLWPEMKSGFYTTTGKDKFSGWTKKKLQNTSQSQTCTKKKKVMVTLWWSTARLIHYSFLNPKKTITSEMYAQKVDELHQKLAMPAASTGNRKSPILLQSSTWPHITQPSPASTTSSSMSTAFCRENASTTTWRQKINAFQEFVKSRSKDFYATGINRHFLLAKMWLVDCNGSYFDY